ncbi:MAG TPA: peptidoglycan-binding domain-containing protein [Terriglobia bacterium]|nr:peptidoglycan-binding domain-containing protein [Terriglobia bacterium]
MKAGSSLNLIPMLTVAATLCGPPALKAVSPETATGPSSQTPHKPTQGATTATHHTGTHTGASHTHKATHHGETSKASHTAKTSSHKSGHQKSSAHRSTAYTRLAHMQMDPGRVEDIQQALIKAGDLQGTPTGRWDTQTREAMSRYQTANGFGVTGLPDAKSLMKLGLGPHPLPPQLDKTSPASPSGMSAGDAAVPSNPVLKDSAPSPSASTDSQSVAPPATADPPAKR